MRQKGFSVPTVIFVLLLLLGSGAFLYKNSNLSLPIKTVPDSKQSVPLPEVSVTEQQIKTLPDSNLYKLNCGQLGFSGGTDSLGYYKPGGKYVIYPSSTIQGSIDKEIALNSEETEKMDKALLTVSPGHPPEYNPNMRLCLFDKINIIVVNQSVSDNSVDLHALVLDKTYQFKDKISVNTGETSPGTPEVLAFTRDGKLYTKIHSFNRQSSAYVDKIFRINTLSKESAVAARTQTPTKAGLTMEFIQTNSESPGWKKYSNLEFGIEFEVPEEYVVQKGYYDINEVKRLEIIIPSKWGPKGSASALMISRSLPPSLNQIKSSAKETIVGGAKAIIYDRGSSLAVAIQNPVLFIAIPKVYQRTEDEERIDNQIISSIRFIVT